MTSIAKEAAIDTIPVEVAHLIMDHLEVRDLCRLSSTNTLSFGRVSEYIHRHCSIRQTLLPFFARDEDFDLFRELQRTHGVLISGSQALSVFTGERYLNSDLDLYVNHYQRGYLTNVLECVSYTSCRSLRPPSLRPSIVHWQSMRDGDTMTLFNDRTHIIARSEYADKSIANVEEFRNGSGVVMQVISSYGPPLDVILGFHSMCIMNVMAHQYAYCLYPKATLIVKASIAQSGDDNNAIRAQNKYTDRGYRLLCHETSTPTLDFQLQSRSVGDRHCRTLPLAGLSTLVNPAEVNKGQRYDELSSHSWTLIFGPEQGDGFLMVYAWLKFPQFKHMLCVCSKVMWSLTPGMVYWTMDKFKEFVGNLF
ncbi:uncharacterized protein ARMOST_17646 [Armillaria ostoyae]|uniref:F-box domain-containing protein n=1 Tax=Armillaria ostoyae TaxID=47428 RepID=A0A284RZL5_ARMOS|nr:uncharacterized protein ARMOST_17646 [Armillaria ostoyae]